MHIYFSGAGGSGIGPLMMLAQQAGHTVSGSDVEESDFTYHAREQGDIDVFIGEQDGHYIKKLHKEKPIDWFVHTSALNKRHKEYKFAMHHDIRISKRDDLINEIIKDNQLKLIAVAGTHGKTTTTAMIIWLMQRLNVPISYSVGSTLSFGPSAQFTPESDYFIYEADEFDRNFLSFNPEIAVITNIGYDHSDTYPTESDYRNSYNKFMSQSKRLVSWSDQLVGSRANLRADDLVLDARKGINEDIGLLGKHNKQNASLALTTVNAIVDKMPQKKAIAALNSFPGTSRRFEMIKRNLYSDYAHHPDEIAATIELAREKIAQLQKVSKRAKQLFIVYQPHQNIRQIQLHENNGYVNCFQGVNKVHWLSTYLSREDSELRVLTPDELHGNLGDYFETAMLDDDLKKQITSHLKGGHVVVGMSAGDLDSWLREHFG